MEVMIRAVCLEDLDRITEIEAICFPAAEAATRESFQERIAAFPESFLVAEIDGIIIGFINGCSTNSSVIYDELFHSTEGHIVDGKNLAVFGLDVIPEYRKQGVASKLMKQFIQVARNNGKENVILTCKERLVHYYESFGFENNGISNSTHGGSKWFDMTLVL
ncbi:GNAT family N-acetyltransferase [Pelosinus propionicus]|uniref:Predicted N-acetyltransferase YhbS n=1 Tax=Pelosinus propionicus DSM 13327 TaxID=1123291 RepID=A0A1I4Q6N0_9FIRM|nr:GNAT family N-acetyltransferase [Pelosinus propionicus]SFM35758.1 Predicted N-acetyltransferase YhbS [Pelosinus propionicus DSM 13327]